MKKQFFLVTMIENFYIFYLYILNIFGILFFYEAFGKSVLLAFVPYIVGYSFYAILVGPVSKRVGKLGTRVSMSIAFILFAFSTIPVYFFGQTMDFGFVVIWLFLFFTGKLFFHQPSIYILGTTSSHEKRGSQISFKMITNIMTGVLTPLVGGFVAESYGLSGIALVTLGVLALAVIPLGFLENQKFAVEFSYKKFFTSVRAHKLLRLNFAGDLPVTANKYWVIFVFLFFSSDFLNVGMLIAFTFTISIILSYILGRFLNSHNRYRSFRLISFLDSFSWLLKTFQFLGLPIIFLDTLGKFAEHLKNQNREVINYDIVNDDIDSNLIDEMVISREIAINVSIVLNTIVVGILIQFVGFHPTFLAISASVFLLAFAIRK